MERQGRKRRKGGREGTIGNGTVMLVDPHRSFPEPNEEKKQHLLKDWQISSRDLVLETTLEGTNPSLKLRRSRFVMYGLDSSSRNQ